METTAVVVIVVGVVIGIIGYFLKEKNERITRELDRAKENIEKNSVRISLVENNHIHLTDRFDLLYDAVKELTQEIKNLNIRLAQKKDKDI
jgi:septation ring formation regulator EzrA